MGLFSRKPVAEVGDIKVYRKGWLNPIYRAVFPNGRSIWDTSLCCVIDNAEIVWGLIQYYEVPWQERLQRNVEALSRLGKDKHE